MNSYGIVAVAMLHNTNGGTYHPMIYRDAPMSGSYDCNAPRRLKSQGHHTVGFPSLDEAKSYVANEEKLAETIQDLDTLLPWDGENSPADVAFVEGGKLVRMAFA